ncbi:hypothetical protein GCM10009557_26340 [Virgisporangium ochraceum]
MLARAQDGVVSAFIEFFVASDDRVAAAVQYRGPASAFPTVSGSFFYAEDAVLAWESSFTGRSVKELSAGGKPRMVAPWVNDGSGVFVLSDELTAHLLRAGRARLQALATEWSTAVVRDGDDLDVDEALRVVVGVTALARAAAESGQLVYCWAAD